MNLNDSTELKKEMARLTRRVRRCEEQRAVLRREKKSLESLIRYSNLAIVTVDDQIRVTSCNAAFEKLFLYKKAELLGKNIDSLIARGETLEEARINSERILKKKSVHTTGLRYRKDGTPVIVELFAVPGIVNGKLVGAYGLFQDISDRVKMEEALRESEERYRQLVELSPFAIGVYGMDGKILFANEAAVKVAGLTRLEDLLGRSVFDFFPPETVPVMQDRLEGLRSGRPQPKIVEKIITVNGRIRHVESRSIPITFQNRDAILTVFQDVSELQEMLDSLRASEERLQRVFQTSPLGIGLIRNRTMLWHNIAMSKILGYAPGELKGKNARMIYPDDAEYRRAGTCIASLGPERKTADIETKWVRKNGEIFDCHVWYSRMDEGSESPTIVAIAEDVTEKNRIEALLRESEARYRQLVEVSPLPITVYDEKELYFANKAAYELLKARSPEDFAGKTVEDFVHPDFLPMVKKRLKRLLNGEFLPPEHEKLLTLQGDVIEAEMHSAPVLHQGKPAVMSVFRDVTEMRKTERKLKEEQERYQRLYEESKRQEELYRSLLNSSADAIVIYNLRGEAEYLSPSFTKIFGWTLDEMRGKRIPFVPEMERKTTMRVIREILDKGIQIHGFETRRFTKDGTILDISISASRFSDAEGNPAGMLVVLRDITEKKAAERKLQEGERRYRELYAEAKHQEELYRSLLNSSADTIVIYNLQGEVDYVNPSFTTTFGWALDEVKGKPLPFVPEEEKASTQAVIDELLRTKKPVHRFETRRLTKDGRMLNMSVSGSLYTDAGGEPIGVLAILRDITDRVKAEEAVRESERRFRELYNSVSDLIFTQDLDGRFLSVNRAIVELFGYTPEEIIGRKGSDFMKPELRPFYESDYLASIKEKGYHKGIAVYFTKDGRKIYLENISTLSKREGNAPHISGIARDVTDWINSQRRIKALQEEMAQAQKMEAIGTLAGGIAHDFNNLLMGIQGNVSLLRLRSNLGREETERLKSIEDYVQSGSDLTMQLLGFARGGRYEVTPTNMNELIRKEANLFGRTKKEIEIHLKFQEDLWVVKVDQGQMAQVFLNLFVNAWQAMPKGGHVYVHTENVYLAPGDRVLRSLKPGRYVRITVSDTGIGMDERTRKRVFEPFFTTKRENRGMGLGLASVYGIIENHGGMIHVESQLGMGTTFTVFLPATAEAVEIENRKETRELVKGMGRILLVDDEEKILEVGKELLEVLGYEVMSASSGREALRIFQESGKRFDLIILDMIMPGMGGGEVFDELRKIDRDVKILLASGYSIDGQASEIMTKGCNGFIQKPFTVEKLSEKIKEILGSK